MPRKKQTSAGLQSSVSFQLLMRVLISLTFNRKQVELNNYTINQPFSDQENNLLIIFKETTRKSLVFYVDSITDKLIFIDLGPDK